MAPFSRSNPLRRRLLALGIPEQEQTLEGLRKFFPPDFEIEELNLDLNALAAVLLHLVGNKIISLPERDVAKQLSQLGSGAHICQFYRSKEDLIELIVPYFLQGLERREYCLWTISPPFDADLAAQALRSSALRLSQALKRGELQILGRDECYFLPSGEMRPLEDILQDFLAKAEDARRRGFSSMRAAGDTSWFSQVGNLAQYLEYERRVTQAVQKAGINGLCTYAIGSCSEDHINDLLEPHHETFLKEGLFWHRIQHAYLGRDKVAAMLRDFAA